MYFPKEYKFNTEFKALKLEFLTTVSRLEDDQLADAYTRLKAIDAPMGCIDVLLERMLDRLGIEEAHRIVDTVD